jgi:sugar/nucleoside kinase (ribokinase family)
VTVPMRVIALGVHVVDVLVRPVTEIPEGQGGALVDSIRITAAGPAVGTALTLVKLGAEVHSAGLGSDHGTFDLGAADALALTTPTRSPVPS